MAQTQTTKTMLAIVLISVVAWFFFLVRSILLPFIISAILAYLLSPVVNWIQTVTRWRRAFAVAILYLFFIIVLGTLAMLLAPRITEEVRSLQENFPGYVQKGKEFLSQMQNTFETKYPIIEKYDLFERSVVKLREFLFTGVKSLPGYLMGIFSIFSVIFLIPVVTFFFVLSGKSAVNAIVNTIPSRYIETSLSLFWEIDEVLGKYIRGLIIEAVAVAILTTIGLIVIDVNYAFLIGIIVAVTNIIPYLGPVMGGAAAIIVGIIQYQNFSIVPKVLIVIVIVQFLENNFIQPIIQSQGMELSPVIIMFAVFAGAELYGVIGMLVAVPVAAMIKVTLNVMMRKRYEQARN